MGAKPQFSPAQYRILLDAAKKAKRRFKTQQDMALALGITQQSVGALLSGKYKPGLAVARSIAELHSTTLEDMVGPVGVPDDRPSRQGVASAPEARSFPNLDTCMRFYARKKQWPPYVTAAARAGFFGEEDVDAPEWHDRLNFLEDAMRAIKRPRALLGPRD